MKSSQVFSGQIGQANALHGWRRESSWIEAEEPNRQNIPVLVLLLTTGKKISGNFKDYSNITLGQKPTFYTEIPLILIF